MALGRSRGFVNSLVWQPPVMARLCARALEAGIEVEYVQELVRLRHLTIGPPPIESETWPWPVKVCTLGRFEVVSDGRPIKFARKVQRRPLALLKAVIAHGGREVREQTLMDTLWPEADGDKARMALTSALHRLRQLLGHQEAVVRKDGAIGLDARTCWVDVWAVERLIERADAAIARSHSDPHAWNEAIRHTDRASELFRGPFLGGDVDAPPSSQVDRLRRRLIGRLLDIGLHWEKTGQPYQATRYYEQGLRIDPCAEDVCRRLMEVYHHLGRHSEVRSVYRGCCEALSAQPGQAPSLETAALAKRLR
jgi:DNA-binding SARP family transcriptional activator